MDSVWDYVLARLAEQSSWRSLVWIGVSLGLLPAESSDVTTQYIIEILRGAAAVLGLIGILFPDKSHWITRLIKRRSMADREIDHG